MEVNLSVRDPERSAAWYAEVFGMRPGYDFASSDGRMRYICLVEPSSELVLCLVGHAANPGDEFSEVRTGLDHLEFLVERHDDLREWAQRLDELGIVHSGVKELEHTPNAMVTF